MTQPLRIGVIGTGFGVHHIEVLREVPGCAVVGVCSARAARADAVAARFGIPLATSDFRALLERVDAVVVATPPALHASMTLAAAAAGVHVLCEKPMAVTLDQALAMREAADAAGIVAMLNYQQRFAPHFRHAAALVQEGAIGRLLVAELRVTINPVDYLRLPLWSDSKTGWFADAAQGGGLLASSVGPHLADLLLWQGGPIAEVAARTIVSRPVIPLAGGGELRDISAEDGFVLLGRYASGALLTMRGIPVGHSGYEWLLELHGDAGSLVVANDRLLLTRSGTSEPAPVAVPAALDLRHAIATTFVEAARAGGPSPSPSFADGSAAQAVLAAALEAARSGAWVAVRQP
jgi:predicted dehydrogenase